ncbi:hypothetical protein [Myxosarcina sp. GI1]|uniref:hypothetical protein n=1 Tax=Myxosarcina sp. GI1 TaxID=1541065 RepID=UPI00055EDC3A|nr:hypothetical protein [Myxosarcina sp. GI1]
MTPNPQLLQSVEQLNYRVTVGDVAAQAGIELNLAQQGLLALATDAGGHLQVAESGDVVYLFPKNFRSILRNKYWQMRWQQWWGKVWRILFYIIRISFGVVLIASIALMLAAIAIIVISVNSSRDEDNRGGGSFGGGSGFVFLPRFWFGPDLFWFFSPNYSSRRRQRRRISPGNNNQMNFFEAIFSFLFGDGNPNEDLEAQRWQTIGGVIRNNKGAVVGEQIAPYVDGTDEYEDYMLPVLSRFNGYPEVSPQGEIIYYFPELQVMASQRQKRSSVSYLQEQLWRFSQASSNQIMLSVGLGALNLVLALVLGSLLRDGTIAAQLGGLVAFVGSIYGILLVYGVAFLTIPLIRYFWIQRRNQKIAARNQLREQRAIALNNADTALQQKIVYASQFAQQKVIGDRDLAYTTETDLLDQNIENADKIDREWQQRLQSDS